MDIMVYSLCLFAVLSQMVELEFNRNTRSVSEVDVLLGSEMIAKNTGNFGSICFVVRRPG